MKTKTAHNIKILNYCFFTKKHLRRLRAVGKVTIYENTKSKNEATQRLKGTEIAVANGLFAPLTGEVLRKAKDLKLLIVNSTGYDFVDMNAAAECGIRVANVPGFSTEAVAEYVFALLFAIVRKLPTVDKAMRKTPFEVNPGEEKSWSLLGNNLQGKTLGIVGLGTIGKRVAELGKAFGMNVLAYSRTPKKIPYVRCTPFQEVLKKSDVVSLHLALTPETKKIISKKELKIMKPASIIINTARGELIDTGALARALKRQKIAGAGLDMIANAGTNRSICKEAAVICSPHVGWWTHESVLLQSETIVETIEAFIKGRPIHIISRPR